MGVISAKKYYTIYGIMNPTNNKFFYVGKTFKPVEDRLKEHYNSQNLRVKKKIRSIVNRGFTPTVVCLCRCDYIKASNKEQYWIYKLINDGHKLYNKVLIP